MFILPSTLAGGIRHRWELDGPPREAPTSGSYSVTKAGAQSPCVIHQTGRGWFHW